MQYIEEREVTRMVGEFTNLVILIGRAQEPDSPTDQSRTHQDPYKQSHHKFAPQTRRLTEDLGIPIARTDHELHT